jgi:peptidoglycan/LPS O-acetylase OafA/YrhL
MINPQITETKLRIEPRVEFANTLRGLAVMSVLIAHYLGVFWVARDAVSSLTNTPVLPLDKYPVPYYLAPLSWFPLFNIGAYGVALFFLISGFVIPFSIRKNSVFIFIIQRVFRIFPVYMLGFNVTLLAIWLGGFYFGKLFPFSFQEIAVHLIPGIRDILWSRNIDGIVWTLEIEMKFYLLCALCSAWFKRDSKKVFLVPLGMSIVSLLISPKIDAWAVDSVFLYRQGTNFTFLTIFSSFMFIGVVFNYLHRNKIDSAQAFPLILGLQFTSFLVWSFSPHKISAYLGWTYGFALFTFAFAYAYPRFFKFNPITNFFADISYPLYVIHGVAGYVALRILLERGMKAWLSIVLVTLGVIGLSYLIHHFIEKPSQNFGRKLAKQTWIKSSNPI